MECQRAVQRLIEVLQSLPTLPLCLNCHGSPEQLTPAVKEKLKALYPDDKAIGYRPAAER